MRLTPHERTADAVDDSVHIASFIVQVDASRMNDICQAVIAIDGIEIHATDPCGKIVLTAESSTQGGVLEALDAIRESRGVFSANLVYHQIEDRDALEEELSV